MNQSNKSLIYGWPKYKNMLNTTVDKFWQDICWIQLCICEDKAAASIWTSAPRCIYSLWCVKKQTLSYSVYSGPCTKRQGPLITSSPVPQPSLKSCKQKTVGKKLEHTWHQNPSGEILGIPESQILQGCFQHSAEVSLWLWRTRTTLLVRSFRQNLGTRHWPNFFFPIGVFFHRLMQRVVKEKPWLLMQGPL